MITVPTGGEIEPDFKWLELVEGARQGAQKHIGSPNTLQAFGTTSDCFFLVEVRREDHEYDRLRGRD